MVNIYVIIVVVDVIQLVLLWKYIFIDECDFCGKKFCNNCIYKQTVKTNILKSCCNMCRYSSLSSIYNIIILL